MTDEQLDWVVRAMIQLVQERLDEAEKPKQVDYMALLREFAHK